MYNDSEQDLLRKMLGSPDCQFEQKWIDEAIIEWVNRHMCNFLQKNPQLCWVATQSDAYLSYVMEAIPLTDEYEPLIRQIIRRISELNFPAHTDEKLCRFIGAGRIDLLAEIAPKYLENDEIKYSIASESVSILDVISANSAVTVQVMSKVDWHRVKWSTNVILTAIGKLSPEELQKVIETSNFTSRIKDMPFRIIVAICQKLPLDALKIFAKRYRKIIKHAAQCLACMACGRDDFQSVGGYTLHRKKCDPMNEHPSMKEILATRLGYVFKSSPQMIAPACNT